MGFYSQGECQAQQEFMVLQISHLLLLVRTIIHALLQIMERKKVALFLWLEQNI
jgi:hypothetical protein